jgi:uncharacterized RDD family membrane protein YckC
MSAIENKSSDKAAEQTVTVAGFGLRLAAFLIDALIVGFFGLVLGVLVGIVAFLIQWLTPSQAEHLEILVVVCGIIFSIAYYVAGWANSGQTVGKGTLGLKVVGPDGQPPSGGQAVLRYVGYLVSAIVVSLGFVWILFDRKRQGWHDKLAKTYVVYSDEEFSDVNAVKLVPSDDKPNKLWIVLWVILIVATPLGMLSMLLLAGPYIGALLISFLQGLQ